MFFHLFEINPMIPMLCVTCDVFITSINSVVFHTLTKPDNKG